MDIFLHQSSDCRPLYVELSFTPNSRQSVRCETCLFYTQSLHRCCSLSLYRSDKEKQNPQSTHRVAMATVWRIFYQDRKISPGWWGCVVHAPLPFTISTITYKVFVVYAPAERADTLTLFSSTHICTVLCGRIREHCIRNTLEQTLRRYMYAFVFSLYT
jgi:hypothetical protein